MKPLLLTGKSHRHHQWHHLPTCSSEMYCIDADWGFAPTSQVPPFYSGGYKFISLVNHCHYAAFLFLIVPQRMYSRKSVVQIAPVAHMVVSDDGVLLYVICSFDTEKNHILHRFNDRLVVETFTVSTPRMSRTLIAVHLVSTWGKSQCTMHLSSVTECNAGAQCTIVTFLSQLGLDFARHVLHAMSYSTSVHTITVYTL